MQAVDDERGCGLDDLAYLLALALKVVVGVVVGSVALYLAARLVAAGVMRTRYSGVVLLEER